MLKPTITEISTTNEPTITITLSPGARRQSSSPIIIDRSATPKFARNANGAGCAGCARSRIPAPARLVQRGGRTDRPAADDDRTTGGGISDAVRTGSDGSDSG